MKNKTIREKKCQCCGKKATLAYEVNDNVQNATWLDWCGKCDIMAWFLDKESLVGEHICNPLTEATLSTCSMCE